MTLAEDNDEFRRSLRMTPTRRVFLTAGVSTLPPEDLAAVLKAVTTFDTFTEDNDPHKEHDFGSVTHKGEKYFWKIDYYDARFEMGGDEAKALTVMKAEEY